MTLLEYSNSKQVQDAATAYAEKHGGSFFWEEPGGGFVYELEEDTFSPPADATVDQVLKGKSMIRYLPPKGTAGLAVFSVRTLSRLPWPPASSIAITRFF